MKLIFMIITLFCPAYDSFKLLKFILVNLKDEYLKCHLYD